MTEKRRRGYAPRVGRDFALTWATAYGSAWVLAEDVIEFPGVFSNFNKFQTLERAMQRCGYFLERQPYDGRTYLYRLPPETVQELLYGAD
jgi:hypothetical protein